MLPEIKHSDWLKIVMELGTPNQNSLFQHSIAALLKNYLRHHLLESISE